jgi:hypothetical protein
MYDFDVVCGVSDGKTFPEEYEIPRTVGIKNQGNVGACVACTCTEIAEAIFGKEMSEAWAYGRLRDAKDNFSGMYTARTLDMWKSGGLVPLSDFGVLKEMPEIRKLTNEFPDLDEVAKKYQIGGYASINYASMEKREVAVKEALMRDDIGLVAVANDYFGTAHCIRLTGWNDKNNTYKFQNSWGIEYGDEGYAEIPRYHIDYIYAVFTKEFKLPFEDVPEDKWSYKAIKNLYFAGLINGVTDTLFEPERNITREEVAAIVDRLLKSIDDKIENIYKQLNTERNVK